MSTVAGLASSHKATWAHTGGMEIWLLTVLVLIALAAPRYGADSRWSGPGGTAQPRRHTPVADLRALRHGTLGHGAS